MFGQAFANLAALGSDIGKAARGQVANGGNETERLTPIYHDASAV
jgi:hypothetical protein